MALIDINLDEMNVLIVDDSRTDRLLLKSILEEIGVGTIKQAEEGDEALKILQVFPADLVLSDLHMAPTDGIKFTRLLRSAKSSPNPFVPILMLTADATQERLNEALDAGVNGFLGKPIKPETMRRQIQSIFSRPMVYERHDCCFSPVRSGPQADSKPKPNGKAKAAPATAKPKANGQAKAPAPAPQKSTTAAKPAANGQAKSAAQTK